MLKDILQSIHRPAEIKAMLKLKFSGDFDIKMDKSPLENQATHLNEKEFCYAALNKVSRSFAVVIHQLPEELREAVCIFYLVLRGLDSVEDDMEYAVENRLQLLRDFHLKCKTPGWKIDGVGDSHDYKVLLSNFDKVIHTFLKLDNSYQEVILDICKKMGTGMAEYAERKVISIQDYDDYCYYVAGLVGIGLSGLFAASGLENENLKNQVQLSNSMGLLLQKTNITRDYYEDINLGRAFWPKEIWGKYAPRLDELMQHPSSAESLGCLNELVTDALKYICDCLEYLSQLTNKQIFRFCAIPQVMALATLEKIYNNADVYTEVIKIRKGIAAYLIIHTNDLESVHKVLENLSHSLLKKLNEEDPNYNLTKERIYTILAVLHRQKYTKNLVSIPEMDLEKCVLF